MLWLVVGERSGTYFPVITAHPCKTANPVNAAATASRRPTLLPLMPHLLSDSWVDAPDNSGNK
jgi:hypothetical protein